jgi:hypothetical protein
VCPIVVCELCRTVRAQSLFVVTTCKSLVNLTNSLLNHVTIHAANVTKGSQIVCWNCLPLLEVASWNIDLLLIN